MSDTVQIVVIVAVALVIVLFIFRRQLSDFRFKGGKEGVDMQLKTRKQAAHPIVTPSAKRSSGITVSGNKLWGRKNKITVQATDSDKINAEDNQLVGENQEVTVGSKAKKRK